MGLWLISLENCWISSVFQIFRTFSFQNFKNNYVREDTKNKFWSSPPQTLGLGTSLRSEFSAPIRLSIRNSSYRKTGPNKWFASGIWFDRRCKTPAGICTPPLAATAAVPPECPGRSNRRRLSSKTAFPGRNRTLRASFCAACDRNSRTGSRWAACWTRTRSARSCWDTGAPRSAFCQGRNTFYCPGDYRRVERAEAFCGKVKKKRNLQAYKTVQYPLGLLEGHNLTLLGSYTSENFNVNARFARDSILFCANF